MLRGAVFSWTQCRSGQTSPGQCLGRLVTAVGFFQCPKVWHFLRCTPSIDNLFDSYLRSALSRIYNTNISDIQWWLQASLPVKHGGLGIRQVRSLALHAFFASAASTLNLQSQMLSASSCTIDTYLDSYLTVWQAAHGPVFFGPFAVVFG